VHGKRSRPGSSYEANRRCIVEYLVRWEGLGDVETWQDLGDLDERCARLVREFHATTRDETGGGMPTREPRL